MLCALTSLSPSKLNVAARGSLYCVNLTLCNTVIPSRCKCCHLKGPLSLANTTCKNKVPFFLVFSGISTSSCLVSEKDKMRKCFKKFEWKKNDGPSGVVHWQQLKLITSMNVWHKPFKRLMVIKRTENSQFLHLIAQRIRMFRCEQCNLQFRLCRQYRCIARCTATLQIGKQLCHCPYRIRYVDDK